MKKKHDVTAVTSAVHLIAVLSVIAFGTAYITLGILAIPAMTAAFSVGREVILKRFDVYDSLTKRFFREVRQSMDMMRYFPVQLLIILQAAGAFAAGRIGIKILVYLLIASSAFLVTFLMYVITCHVFFGKDVPLIRTAVAMFYRPVYLISVWAAMVLVIALGGSVLFMLSLVIGAAVLLLCETAAFLGLSSFFKASGTFPEELRSALGDDIVEKL